ncbi:thioredoxin reductase [Myxococcus stipitatus DSM 14675]|uniref:Thioredoxin reductase n=1 Tax=Myxococcus stipitatus (strain DSM 14675 / JCM 12634 / Mx s8) TaxID=1278073 RepID=L7U9R8_MYXSD|nr:tryptophan halogenase family protein [Myxococcus stipitatus]AGC44605.1 thioredoxin reductase [Myxococcus stipitatus DSM 14675]
MDTAIREVVILGGGTAGWMTAAYLQKVFEGTVQVTLLEAATIPRIGVGEATVPNLQRVFFDRLGIPENEWMRECNAAFKTAVKFVNWRKKEPGAPDNHFYHAFGLIPNVDNIPLSHYWVLRNEGRATPDEQVDYACYREPPMMDAKLAPRFRDGRPAVNYAWHFDAQLVADYLRRLSTGWGVKHVVDELASVEKTPDGHIKALHTKGGRVLGGDLFVDCSGFRGLLINQAMEEPFLDMSDHLLCNSAVATAIEHDDAKHGIEPYTSAIASKHGWMWKIPMLGRFGTGYVYSSEFCSQDEAIREFSAKWGLDPEKTAFNRIRFRVGRNRRAWVKNCVSIGLASCFVEPLESTGIYFITASIYQLAKHFPDKGFNPVLMDRFNREVEMMFDDTRDFLQAHFLTSSRDDTPFWLANKNDLKLSDALKDKLETWKTGLTVNMPVSGEEAYYGNFETEFRNFWTNSSYYCVLSGMGWMPEQPLTTLKYRPSSVAHAEEAFQRVKLQQQALLQGLPTNHEFLQRLHRKNGMDLAATGTG